MQVFSLSGYIEHSIVVTNTSITLQLHSVPALITTLPCVSRFIGFSLMGGGRSTEILDHKEADGHASCFSSEFPLSQIATYKYTIFPHTDRSRNKSSLAAFGHNRILHSVENQNALKQHLLLAVG